MHDMALGFFTKLPNLVVATIFDDIFGQINPLVRFAITAVLMAAVLAFFAASYVPGLAQKMKPAYFGLALFGLLIAGSVIAAFTEIFVF